MTTVGSVSAHNFNDEEMLESLVEMVRRIMTSERCPFNDGM
eukprot:CAMPEP_0184415888 /NCGR_PEP_ID=MMETSP0738-20130409/9071_1 /TAXON_ID=385413 /ORGANISM="Thalassiosira miniscula, Strain CCMP1093" /LENGTH=40 /DNA_ID= /DNA_START= /DNA_END= /DNA_ORIENTATION=